MGKNKRSTPQKQTLILWALLARDQAASFQNELKPEPDKVDREPLEKAGLIRSEKKGRHRAGALLCHTHAVRCLGMK